jgi:hypothetical protein
MEINQFIFMLLMALHFAPSNANKINIELADNRKMSFVKQANNYWEGVPKNELTPNTFKLKGHELHAKMGAKAERYLAIQDILAENGDAINWQEVKIIRKGEQAAMLFERKENGINIILSEDDKKSEEDQVFQVQWEIAKKQKK